MVVVGADEVDGVVGTPQFCENAVDIVNYELTAGQCRWILDASIDIRRSGEAEIIHT